MAALVNGNEVVLNGCVGDPSGWGWDDCFTASDVILALAQIGDANDVTVRINSGGGIATEGSAIHSALARHKGKKTVIVEGIAASAASIVAMAGDEVSMSLGALMMIHDPQGMTVGTISDHQQQIKALTALGDAMSTIYAAKSGQTAEQCRADMQEELWMTADQAVAKGYANRVDAPAGDAPIEPAAFNYTAYAHAPARMIALTTAKHWDRMKSQPTAEAAPDNPNQEAMVPTEAEIQARIDAAVAAEREKTKTEAASDPSAAASSADVPATAMSRSDAAEIAKLCNDGGVPAMTASLLAAGATVDQARTKINAAGQIKDMVAVARQGHPRIPETLAATMIAEGKSVEDVRAVLFDQMVSLSDERPVTSYHRAGTGGANHGADAGDARAKSKASMQAELRRNGMLPKKEG